MTKDGLRIAIFGFGKLGKEIQRCAAAKAIEVTAIFDPQSEAYSQLDENGLHHANVVIDCSTPTAVIENLATIASLKKDIVVATTGWQDRLDEVANLVRSHGIGLIYSSNFSIGMMLFQRIVAEAAKRMALFPEYDVAVSETHHIQKKDAPSGTALTLAGEILKASKTKTELTFRAPTGKIDPGSLYVSSVRLGQVPGIHTVTFDGSSDTIELRHTARNRTGFAEGILLAAGWIIHKKGMYTLQEMMDELESV